MKRAIEIVGDVAYVPLTQGKTAVIDAELAPVVVGWNWHAVERDSGLWYAARTQAGRNILLHREIMGAATGELVDHEDGDGLNCRRENMRLATHQESMRNRRGWSGLPKGVAAYYTGYVAVIGVDGGRYRIGALYESPEEASAVYELFAKAIFGEFYRQSSEP